MDKLFIKSEDLLKDSFQLAWNVYKSGFQPNYIVGVWRGGAPIGIAVQESLVILESNLTMLQLELRTILVLMKKKKVFRYMG